MEADYWIAEHSNFAHTEIYRTLKDYLWLIACIAVLQSITVLDY